MSETPHASDSPNVKSPKPPPRPRSPSASPARQAPPWATFAALGLAVLAVVLGLVGWFYPKTGPGKFNDGQRQEAKANICAAQGTARQATGINTNMVNPVPGNPAGDLAVAANARLALYAGGDYLHQQLAETPATPKDVAEAAGNMADTMQKLGINYLAGAAPDDAVQQPLRNELNNQIAELDGLCQQ